ncbi:MAG: hypothetical protein IJL06_00770 [Kiritimatiellae bacterium]|nr:hypothetical protein [Kiritimatiellia bacterium]
MKLYRHWVERSCEIAGTTFRFRDGSNVSAAEAEAKIDRRVELLRRTEGRDLSVEESDAVHESLLDIGGRRADGGYESAICEEILEEPDARNAVTRNRYGAEVLNSEDTCFLDVDEVRRPWTAGETLFRWAVPAAVFAAVSTGLAKGVPALRAALGFSSEVHGWLFPSVFLGLVCALPFAARAGLRKPPASDDPEATLLAKVRALAEMPAWRGVAARVYRTAAGFRVLVQADGLLPRFDCPPFRELERTLGADARYVCLCNAQGCWRARLTPKPERVGLKRPPRETRFPRAPEAEPAFAAWLDGYRKASEGFAVCEPVATVGRFVENGVVRLHDERTRCGSGLPLA